jgi:hypothetical protein
MDNQLKEIKNSILLEEQSFTYAFSSDDNLTSSNMNYEINFGGFEEPYDNYKLEVINCGHNGAVRIDLHWLYLLAENLADDGNVFRSKVRSREIVLATLPLQSSGDEYLRFTGGSGNSYTVKNCRISKRIKLRIIRPDFLLLADGLDINIGRPTRWFVMLKMTPIVDDDE